MGWGVGQGAGLRQVQLFSGLCWEGCWQGAGRLPAPQICPGPGPLTRVFDLRCGCESGNPQGSDRSFPASASPQGAEGRLNERTRVGRLGIQ